MKIKYLCLVGLLALGVSTGLKAQTYNQLWDQVLQASSQSKPQTAIRLTTDIFKKAEREKNSTQMLMAYMERADRRNRLTPDSFYVYLKDMEQWAATTNKPLDKAVLHSLIAEIYADYAQQNAWQIRQRRDIVNEEPSADIREWSGNMFVNQVIKNTREALKNVDLLFETSTKTYIPFVKQGATSNYNQHDMYHLMGRRGVQSLERLQSMDNDTVSKKEIQDIYQQMISVYRKAGNEEALVLIELDYLNWKSPNDYRPYRRRVSNSNIDLSGSKYILSLDSLISQYKAKPVCAEVYLAKAQYLFDNNDLVSALHICDEAIGLYPLYRRINALKQLKQNILIPELNVTVDEMVYPGSEFELRVDHQNLDGFTVRFYRVTKGFVSSHVTTINNAFYTNNTVKISEQHIALSRSADYQQRDTTLTLKAPEEGCYVMRITPDAKASESVGRFLYVSRLTLLSRRTSEKYGELITLDRKTGHPVPDVTVTVYSRDYKALQTFTTNAEGKGSFEWTSGYSKMRAWKGTDRSMPYQDVYNGYVSYGQGSGMKTPMEKVSLLTDRSLYRPGQTVYVKGIVYEQDSDSTRVVAYAPYTLTVLDVNQQEVGRQSVRTNEFGSFTTSFALPAVCLNGRFSISMNGKWGISIMVQEYKRPTFDVKFDKQQGTYSAGDSVQVSGSVKTFSGVALQDLPVQYKVTRSYFFGWRSWNAHTDIIASGTAKLDADGKFNIPVLLAKASSGTGMENAFYHFQVEATVTNLAGETQSEVFGLSVGPRSLLLNADLPERVCKDEVIKATFKGVNLEDEPVEVQGTYKLYPMTDVKKEIVSGEAVYSGTFTTNHETTFDEWKTLPSGVYQLVLSTKDMQGREVTEKSQVELFSTRDTRPAMETPVWFYQKNEYFSGTQPSTFYFGTSFKDTYVLMSVYCDRKILENKVLMLSDTICSFSYPYKEEYGKGIIVSFGFVKEGKLYSRTVNIKKPLVDRNLKLKWEVFRDKLRPGQQEEWKLTVKLPQGTPADAEMLALMYDASLDKIWKYKQQLKLTYPSDYSIKSWEKPEMDTSSYHYWFPRTSLDIPSLQYDYIQRSAGYDMAVLRYYARNSAAGKFTAPVIKMDEDVRDEGEIKSQDDLTSTKIVISIADMKGNDDHTYGKDIADLKQVVAGVEAKVEAGDADLKNIEVRSNFSETAFFFPQLRTNERGEISFSFTMPESLTRWNFRGFAHTKAMFTGMIDGETMTSKEFMLTPNLPRFVRVGDKTSVAASVANFTGEALNGTVDFVLFDPMTEAVISTQKQKFTVAAGQTTAVSFRFTATDKYDVLGCRLVADGGTFSDGEQHLLPVLSNKEVLVETVALPVRGEETKTFSLEKLFNHHSKTATNQQLTVEFTANPMWYAVQALPALSQPTNDNAISWATAYYANSLASYIMNNQPRIKAVFDSWKLQGGSKETFLSNLQKNQEVKNILLSESPWVMEAKNEQQQKERIATLFDLNTISNNNSSARIKLKELQLPDGSWPWYKGMYGSEYITLYIAGLNARLVELTGRPMEQGMLNMQTSALTYLDKEARRGYNILREIEREGGKVTGISGTLIDYLYIKTISNSKPVSNDIQQYFLTKAAQMIVTASIKDKAKLAVIFDKVGRKQDAQRFMTSLKEHLVQSEEMGMHFAFNESPYAWNGQPIPAHVAVMEAFDRVAKDTTTVEEMKFWLLKQKQTQQWNSPISTADAVYALLERGTNPTNVQAGARLTLGDKALDTEKSLMAGVGYIKETFTDKRVIDAKEITVTKRGKGAAWGAVYACFEEQSGQVKQHGGELNIEKKLYVERLVNNVRQLEPVTAQSKLKVGDKVVSRITIRTDRAMEFVQLKDQRGACFEPIENLSGYRWGNGFGYYVDVKDASTNFFFDGLGKGVFVLEYAYRVARTGTYDAGLATIQCAYAPEYASHSAAMTVVAE